MFIERHFEELEARIQALEAWREEIDPEGPTCEDSSHGRNVFSWNYCPACGEEL